MKKLAFFILLSLVTLGVSAQSNLKWNVNAGVWTVGVILGSNEMGLTQEETGKLPAEELNRRMAAVRKRMYMAGAHYVVNTIAELPEIIEIINHKMN